MLLCYFLEMLTLLIPRKQIKVRFGSLAITEKTFIMEEIRKLEHTVTVHGSLLFWYF